MKQPAYRFGWPTTVKKFVYSAGLAAPPLVLISAYNTDLALGPGGTWTGNTGFATYVQPFDPFNDIPTDESDPAQSLLISRLTGFKGGKGNSISLAYPQWYTVVNGALALPQASSSEGSTVYAVGLFWGPTGSGITQRAYPPFEIDAGVPGAQYYLMNLAALQSVIRGIPGSFVGPVSFTVGIAWGPSVGPPPGNIPFPGNFVVQISTWKNTQKFIQSFNPPFVTGVKGASTRIGLFNGAASQGSNFQVTVDGNLHFSVSQSVFP